MISLMKLVRDKICDIPGIRRKYRFKQLESDEEYLEALKQKLVEEAKESSSAQSKIDLISELVDLLEVIDEIRKLLKVTVIQMGSLKEKKLKEKGGFSRRTTMLSR